MVTRRTLSIIAGSACAVLLALYSGAAIWVANADLDGYREAAAVEISDALGRAVSIDGSVDASLFPVPSITIQDVTVRNPDWTTDANLATVDTLTAKVGLRSLFFGDIEIVHIGLENAVISLEKGGNGRRNWVLDSTTPGEAVPAKSGETEDISGLSVDVREISIKGLSVAYRNRQTRIQYVVAVERLSAKKRFAGDVYNLDVKGRVNDVGLEATGIIGSVRGYLVGGALPMKLSSVIAGARIEVDGILGYRDNQDFFEGSLVADSGNMPKTMAGVAKMMPDVSVPGVFPGERLSFAVKIAEKDRAHRFTDLKVELDKSDIAGEVVVVTGDGPPKIDAKLTSVLLDLPAMVEATRSAPAQPKAGSAKPEADAGKPASRQSIFPTEPISLEFLDASIISLQFSAQAVRLANELEARNVELAYSGNKQGFAIKPISAILEGGQVKASIELRDPKTVPMVAVTADGKGISLGSLLKAAGNRASLTGGETSLTVRLKGKGNSVQTIMASLDGTFSSTIGKGRLGNADLSLFSNDVVSELIERINIFDQGDGNDLLECGVIRAKAISGRFELPGTVGLEMSTSSITAGGVIDLNTETQDVAFRTTPKKGLRLSVGQAVAGLVRIKGPLLEPNLVLDSRGVGETALRIGGAVLTGGLSFLAEQAYRAGSGRVNACEAALGVSFEPGGKKKSRSAAPATGKPSTEPGKGREAGQGARDAAKDAGDGIRRGWNAIFGK